MNKKLLHRFSVLLGVATFLLIFSGGLVTSKGVGMSVPDWPSTYGYNMFFFPFSMWVGGIFHEHLHRLIASSVGFLTVILAVWLWISESRVWLRRLGIVAVFAVILQGVLGGLRVSLMKDQIGIFHGCLAQSFLLLTWFMALATSSWWQNTNLADDSVQVFRKTALALSLLIFVNMAVAATMRHAHAGLSIPDFPTAYGKIIPDLSHGQIDAINTSRVSENQPETSVALIVLQLVHRLIAYVLGIAVPWFSYRLFNSGSRFKAAAVAAPILVFIQISLGAWTIWSNKAADIATAHVAVGASLFVLFGLITIVAFRSAWDAQNNKTSNHRSIGAIQEMAVVS